MTPECQAKPLQIILAEDHEWARLGIRMSLQAQGHYEVVAEAENGQQAVEMTSRHQPDIVLMDINMPVMDGISATVEIKQKLPEMKIVLLTSVKDERLLAQALKAGANAYCMKDIKIERLAQVLEMVAEGARWFDPGINDMLMRVLLQDRPGSERLSVSQQTDPTLTERELEVLEQLVLGKSNKEIADALRITINTVKVHMANIMQKMAADDRTQVVIKALQDKLVQTPNRPGVEN